MSAILPYPVNTFRLSAASPARYWTWVSPMYTVAAGAAIGRMFYPNFGGGRVRNVIVFQGGSGTVGTSWSLDLRLSDATSLFTTQSIATQASGTFKVTDCRSEIALPSGWTRPVLKTDTTLDLAMGVSLDLYTTEVGSYSTHATCVIAISFEPKV